MGIPHAIRAHGAAQPGRDVHDPGVAPDDYLVVALEYVESGQELDPEQLRVWEPLATKVTLGEGGTQTLSLKLAR